MSRSAIRTEGRSTTGRVPPLRRWLWDHNPSQNLERSFDTRSLLPIPWPPRTVTAVVTYMSVMCGQIRGENKVFLFRVPEVYDPFILQWSRLLSYPLSHPRPRSSYPFERGSHTKGLNVLSSVLRRIKRRPVVHSVSEESTGLSVSGSQRGGPCDTRPVMKRPGTGSHRWECVGQPRRPKCSWRSGSSFRLRIGSFPSWPVFTW